MLDYYEILGISPSASPEVIKNTFRQLAKEFHPDKTDGSKASADYFLLLKNAYETLTTPNLKKRYLEERWRMKANNQKFQQPIFHPENILKRAILIKKKYYYSDINRTNSMDLKKQLTELLSEKNIEILNAHTETLVNNAIAETILPVIDLLKCKEQDPFLISFMSINLEESLHQQIKKDLKYNQQTILFQKITPFLLVLALICLCLVIIWMI